MKVSTSQVVRAVAVQTPIVNKSTAVRLRAGVRRARGGPCSVGSAGLGYER
jgi:hypothetical protein